MKKKFGALILCIIMMLTMTISTYASEINVNDFKANRESVLLPEYQTSSKDQFPGNMLRGNFISSAELMISNEGKGKIGVYAATFAHTAVDKIMMKVVLDRWNPKLEEWENITYYDFEALASDAPDQDLTMAIVSFDISGQPRGYYYRLRGIHMVYSGSRNEGYSTTTDGVMIP